MAQSNKTTIANNLSGQEDCQFTDLVIPDNNEQAFIDMAAKLGISRICFLYPHDKIFSGVIAKLEKLSLKEGNCSMPFIQGMHFGIIFEGKQRKFQLKGIPSITLLKITSLSQNTQDIFRNPGIDAICGLEEIETRDSLHYRKSGLNETSASLAHNNGVAIYFSLSALLFGNQLPLPVIRGRVAQNARICRKKKAAMGIASFATDPYGMRPVTEITSILLTLGFTGREAKNALACTSGIIAENQIKYGNRYIGKGILRV